MEGDIMPIKYDKLINLMHEKGITSYTIKRDKVIGQATYKKIIEGGDIDTRTIAKLCKLLNCQPGDILEYSEDAPAPESSEEAKEG
jgi:putative transcriptional regulator